MTPHISLQQVIRGGGGGGGGGGGVITNVISRTIEEHIYTNPTVLQDAFPFNTT